MFEPVTLMFNGQSYRIEPDQVMRAIAIVEDIVTLDELLRYYERGTAPMAKLSMAYGAILRYAGGMHSDSEVYAAMFAKDQNTAISAALSSLLSMMIPKTAKEDEKVNNQGNEQKADSNSSKKRTKR